jgi:hypothetical protein
MGRTSSTAEMKNTHGILFGKRMGFDYMRNAGVGEKKYVVCLKSSVNGTRKQTEDTN